MAPWWKRRLSALGKAARLLEKVQPCPAAAEGAAAHQGRGGQLAACCAYPESNTSQLCNEGC